LEQLYNIRGSIKMARLTGYLLGLFIVFSGVANAQDKPGPRLEINTINYVTQEKIGNITVEVFRDGASLETKTIAANGKIKIGPYPVDHKYKFVFSAPGFINRFVEADLTGIPNESIYEKGWDIPFQMSMVERFPGIDFSTVEPRKTTTLKFNKSSGELDWNMGEGEAYKKEIDKLLKKVEADKKKAEDEKAATEKKYVDAMTAADAAMKSGDYKTAVDKYKDALAANPAKKAEVDSKLTVAETKYKEFQGQQKLKDEYDALMKAGNDKLAVQDYDNAINSYKEALTKIPNDAAANQKIKDAENAKKAGTDKAFTDNIAKAEKAFKEKDYGQAKNFYGEAAKIKPLDPIPAQKIKEIDDQIKKDMENETRYETAIANANKAVLAKKFDDAITNFNDALKVRPGDSEATKGLDEAKKEKTAADGEATLAAQKKKDFDDAVARGDKEFAGKNYDAAMKAYDEALLKFPDEAVKKKKFDAEAAKKKLEDDIAAKKAADEKKANYDKLMADGNTSFNSKSYDAAIKSYQEALATGINNTEAQKKITDTQTAKAADAKALADKEASDKKKADFDAAITAGDGKLSSKDFAAAIIEYNKALALKIDDAAANAKIKAANDAKTAADKEAADKLAADAATKKKADFDAAISSGDGKLSSKDFAGAIADYTRALAMKIDDPAANAKIKAANDAKATADKEAADKALADANAKKKNDFDGFITAGDGKLSSKDFAGAVAEYTKALNLKIDDQAANAKIKAANDAKANADKEAADKALADANAKKKSDFDALISSGDGKLSLKDFAGALVEYNKALASKFDDPTANAKIKEANDAKTTFDKEQADKATADANAKKKIDFDGFITAGNGKLSSKDFSGAVAEYTKALNLKVDDAAANAKIKEANDAKTAYDKEQADKALADANNKKKADFDAAITAGNSKLTTKEFDKAIIEYNKALAFGVDNDAANTKIKEATEAKAAYDLEQKDAATKAAELAEKKKLYAEIMPKAQKDFDAGDFKLAIEKYNKALEYIPGDKIATDQIAKAEAKQKEKEEFAAAQKQKVLDAADKNFNDAKYADAKDLYTRYLGMVPGDTYATGKIKEAEDKIKEAELNAAGLAKKKAFDDIIAAGDGKLTAKAFDAAVTEYQKALATNYNNDVANQKIQAAKDAKTAYDKDQLDKANAEAEAKKREDFNKLIASGDTKVGAKDFDKGIEDYKKALALAIDDPAATAKIEAAQTAKDAFEKDKLAAADLAAKKKLYDAEITLATKDFSAGEFAKAIEGYKKALAIIPDDKYAADQIAKAETEMKSKADLAAAQLQKLLDQADKDFNDTKYGDAKGYYERYLKLKGTDSYAESRIKECDAKVAELAASTKEKERIETAYKDFMTKGDAALKAKKYDDAVALYEGALKVKENDATATAKIEEAKKAKADAANALDMAAKKKQYDEFIAKANPLFDAGSFKEAIVQYNLALDIITNDKFATDRIALANKRIDDNAKEAEERINKILAAADNQFKGENWKEAKDLYLRYLTARNGDNYAQDQVKLCDQKIKEAEGLAQNKAAIEVKYKKFMEEGARLGALKKYDEAIAQFTGALDTKPGDVPAQAGIDAMNKAKGDLFNQAKVNNAAKEKKAAYDAAIATGNAELSAGNYDPAMAAYQDALRIIENDKFATAQYMKAKKLKAEAEERSKAMYDAIVKKADDFFDAKMFKDAKELYTRAQGLRSSDPYPPKRIKECDDMLEKLANLANRDKYHLDHRGVIVTGQSIVDGEKMLEEAKRQEKYQAEQNYVKIYDKNVTYTDVLGDRQDKTTFSTQENYNVKAFERDKQFKENDELRLIKVDSVSEFVNTRDEAYRGAIHSQDRSNLQRQDSLNTYEFNTMQKFKDADKMRIYKSDSVKFYKDYKDDMYRQTIKNYDDENYNKQGRYNDFEYNTEQLYKGKDAMRVYKADSVKFFKDYKDDLYRQTIKNYDKENYTKQGNYNEFELYTEQLYKGKDAMRVYKADSVKFFKDYKDDLYRQTIKNYDKENYTKQGNYNEFELYTEQLYKGKDAMRVYKADSVKFFKDYKDDMYRQTMKNYDKENYTKQANFNEFENYTEQLYKGKDAMREYKADSVKFYKDAKDELYRNTIKSSDKANYDKQGNYNDFEFKTEQQFKEKDGLRQESVTEVNNSATKNETFIASVKKTNAEGSGQNNDEIVKGEEARYNFNQTRSAGYKDEANKYVAVNDANNATQKDFKSDGDKQADANHEHYKTTNPAIPKIYDTGHLSQLAREFGPGTHQWTTQLYNGNNTVTEITTRRIVVVGSTANDYMMVMNKWGTHYTKNGVNCSEHEFQTETTRGQIIEHDK
jgi:tetratricopeptide (TPR) repeat protein